MSTRTIFTLYIFLVLTGLLAACGTDPANAGNSPVHAQATLPPTSTALAATSTETVTDNDGLKACITAIAVAASTHQHITSIAETNFPSNSTRLSEEPVLTASDGFSISQARVAQIISKYCDSQLDQKVVDEITTLVQESQQSSSGLVPIR